MKSSHISEIGAKVKKGKMFPVGKEEELALIGSYKEFREDWRIYSCIILR